MAKKSFKENPALSFISQALTDNTDTHTNANTSTHTHKDADVNTDTHATTNTSTNLDVAEKSTADTEVKIPYIEGKEKYKPSAAQEIDTPPAQMHIFIGSAKESKSKRLQLLLRPSTHNGILQLAKRYQTSVNDIINQILEDCLKKID